MSEINKVLFDLQCAKKIKAEHNAEVKILNSEIKALEHNLLDLMNASDPPLKKLGNDMGSVYIARQVFPHVVNWDEFYEYIRKNNYFHLLERRPSAGAFRESYERGEEVPGLDPVVFDEVRTRKS